MELITILNHCHRFRGFVYHASKAVVGMLTLPFQASFFASKAVVQHGLDFAGIVQGHTISMD